MLMWVNPWGSRYRALAGPPGEWTPASRLLFVAGALAATVPTWPWIQPGDPIADEMLPPAQVAVIVPMVLVFPAAWALLGRSRWYGRRVAALLVGCVAAWSLTVNNLASYQTPPNVDDFLRWYLVTVGAVVGAAGVFEWLRQCRAAVRSGQPPRRRLLSWSAGVVVWVFGCGATVAVPFVDDGMVPPRDALLPLPPTMVLAGEETTCQQGFEGAGWCVRRFTVAASDHAPVRELARGLGQHLERKGWRTKWYEFTPTPGVECRPSGWLANPFRLCVDLRVDERRSTVEVQLAYSNPHDPIF